MKQQHRKLSGGTRAILIVATVLLCLFGSYLGYTRYQAYEHATYAAKVAREKRKIKARAKAQAQARDLTKQETKAVLNTRLNHYFQQELVTQLKSIHFVGSAILSQNGAIVAQYSAGYADYNKLQANTNRTAFEIDSLQKCLTGTLVMQEVEAGKLSLDDLLAKYYPQVPHSNEITLRQMLAMKSGLTMSGMGSEAYTSDEKVIAYDIDHLNFSPSSYNTENYQPINFVLLAGILMQVTGRSYRQLFHERIITALGLKHTTFGYEMNSPVATATAYPITDALLGNYNKPMTLSATQQHLELGTGQVFMSASDFYETVRSIFDGTLISTASVQELFVSGGASPYSGGFYNGPQVRYANGLGAGFESTVYLSQNGQSGVVLMSNYGVNYLSLKGKASLLINLVL